MDNDGVVDKFVGDEAIGLFIPAYSGLDHRARRSRRAARCSSVAGRPDASTEGPIPVGAGVHIGVAFVGTVGSSKEISDFTALGDPVNTTARLASLASAGELLVSVGRERESRARYRIAANTGRSTSVVARRPSTSWPSR